MDFVDARYYLNDEMQTITPDQVSFVPFNVGVVEEENEPSTNIESLKISGASGAKYYDETLPAQSGDSIYISYQDSLNPLSLFVELSSDTAISSSNRLSYPYNNGDILQITVSDIDGEDEITTIYEILINVTEPSTENSLINLTANQGTLSPSFDPEVLVYDLNLKYTEQDVTINASVDETDLSELDKTQISKSFPVGTTTETFTVTAEDGTTKTYTINVNREAPSTSSVIDQITVNGHQASFNDESRYSYTLSESVNNFSFKVHTESEYASIQYKNVNNSTYSNLLNNQSTQLITIANDETIIFDVKVIAQDGTETIYQLEVYKEASSDTSLNDVVLTEGSSTTTLTPSNNTIDYLLQNNGIDEINIAPNVADNASWVIVSPTGSTLSEPIIYKSSLDEGTHQYSIVVTAQDGTTETYVFDVNKLSSNKDLESVIILDRDNGMEEIIFSSDDFTYDEDTYTYIYRFDYDYNNIRLRLESVEGSIITASNFVEGSTPNRGYRDLTLSNETRTVTVTVEAEDGSLRNYTFSFNRRAADSTNTLQDLRVAGETIDGFDPNRFTYDRIILPSDTESVFIEGVLPEGTPSTVLYNNQTTQQISLIRGEVRTINVLVTAQDGSTNTYTFEVIAASDDNTINNIDFTQVDYSFNQTTDSYNLGSVPFSTDRLNFNISLNDSSAQLYVNGNPIGSTGHVLLDQGENSFTFYAVSEYGTKGTEYTYEITRRAASSDATLHDLEVIANGNNLLVGENAYDPNTRTYDLRVDRDINEVTINAIRGDKIITISGDIGINPLNPGTETFNIRVTAEDGITQITYRVNIQRANDDTTINDITVDGVSINFTPDTFEYHLGQYAFDKASILIDVTPNDPFASVSLEGVQTLADGTNVFNVRVISDAGTEGALYTLIAERIPARTDNNLDHLEVIAEGEDLLVGSEGFNTNKTNYTIRVDNTVDTVMINASTLVGAGATISGAGELTLSSDQTVHQVVVTAENGQVKTYTIEITRQNDINDIDNIELNDSIHIPFDPPQENYDLGSVAFSVDTLTYHVTLADNSATLYVNGNPVSRTGSIELTQGENTVTFYAVSEYGTKGTEYTYVIIRDEASNDATLTDLEVIYQEENLLVGDLAFDPDRLVYEFRVDRSVDEVRINASRTGKNITVSGDTGRQPLSNGEQSFRITVTAEDGETQQTYLIKITRANDKTDLLDLEVNGESIGFNPETFEYNLGEVPFNTQSINLNPILKDPHASVNISGEVTLVDGLQVIEVYVTSEYGTKGETYRLTIERTPARSDQQLESLEALVDGENVLSGDNLFSPGKNHYEIRVDNDVNTIDILATVASDSGSTVTGTETLTLNNPVTVHEIIVTAEDGTKNTYTIEITKLNDNYTIDNIIFDGFETVTFDDTVFSYDLGEVSYSMNSLNLNVFLADASAKVFVNNQAVNPSSTVTLNQGANIITIYAQSEYGSESERYTYQIYRKEASNDASLEDLRVIVGGENILVGDNVFDPNQSTYELRVDRIFNQARIEAIRGDKNITITGDRGDQGLTTGLNTFRITVTAEDGETQRTYVISITRANDNHEITDILVNNETINFDPEQLTYDLGTMSQSTATIHIDALLADSHATLTGTGTKTLNTGLNTFTVYATSEYGTKGQTYTITITKEEPYDDARLEDLIISDGEHTLSFDEGSFNPNIFRYTITLSNDSTLEELLITPKLLEEAFQTLSGDIGVQPLHAENGAINQTFNITVTGDSGKNETYIITVIKNASLSSDTSIKEVSLRDAQGFNYLSFDASVAKQIDISVGYDTSSLTLTVIPNHPNAEVIGNGTYTINTNQTITISFKVIAEDGTEASLEYSVDVFRESASSDNHLKDLQVLVDGVDLLTDNNAFSPSKYTYTLKVDRSVDMVDIIAIKNHSNARINGDINQVEITPGANELRIFVVAEDGTQRTYRINIEVVNSEASLQDILVDGYDLEFDPAVDQYIINEIPYTTNSLDVTAIFDADTFSTVVITGADSLKDGLNIITVTITSEDQTNIESYVIYATRNTADANNYLDSLIVKGEGTILPFEEGSFNKQNNTYTIILDKRSQLQEVEILATAENGSIPQGIGMHQLNEIAGTISSSFNITVTAEDGSTNTYTINVLRADSGDLSNDHDIRNVTINTNNRDYFVNFNPDVTVQQSVTIDYQDSSFFLDVEAHPNARVIGSKLYTLNPGQTQTITFYVEAENGVKGTEYRISVTRALPDSDTTPERIYAIVNGRTVEIDPSSLNHTIEVAESTSSIRLHADIKETQRVTGTGTHNITQSVQTFNIVVLAENGDAKVYNIQTIRRNTDTSYQRIEVDGTNYLNQFINQALNLGEVPYAQTTLHINGIPTNPGATSMGNGTVTLEVGVNVFEIYVENEIGEAGQTHTITVERKAPSQDATLSELIVYDQATDTILNYAPTFNPQEDRYIIELLLDDPINEIRIEATPNSPLARISSGVGVYTLRAASSQTTEIFDIAVTAEDGSIKVYEVHVTRDLDPENDVSINRLSLYGNDTNYLGTTQNALKAFSTTQKDVSVN